MKYIKIYEHMVKTFGKNLFPPYLYGILLDMADDDLLVRFTMNELTSRLERTRTNISKCLNELEKHGFIKNITMYSRYEKTRITSTYSLEIIAQRP